MDLQMPVMGGVEASKEIFSLMQTDLDKQRLCRSKSSPFQKSKALNEYLKSIEDLGQLEMNAMSKIMPCMKSSLVDSKILKSVDSKCLESKDHEVLTYIVALTSYTNEDIKNRCLAVGMQEVLNKPLNFKHLHRVIWKYFFRVDQEAYLLIYNNKFNTSYSEDQM
jgi:CheY-like chemotaxis protein